MKPQYRGHIELIRFKEYGMPRGIVLAQYLRALSGQFFLKVPRIRLYL